MGAMSEYYRKEEALTGPRVWITKDERLIPYQELVDSHLLNILKMLRRSAVLAHQAQVLVMVSGSKPQTDLGMEHFEMEVEAMEMETWREHVTPQFWQLYREASSRPAIAAEALAIVQDDCRKEGALIGLALLSEASKPRNVAGQPSTWDDAEYGSEDDD